MSTVSLPKDALDRITYWGVPDWRDLRAYPSDNPKTTNDEWRWEFLRRDRDYRSIAMSWNKGWGIEEADPEMLIEYGLAQLHDPRLNYKKLYPQPIFQKYPVVLNDRSNPPWGYYDLSEAQEREIDYLLEDPDNTRYVDVRFDLNRPLSPQLNNKDMQRALEARQKKLFKKILRLRISDRPSAYLRSLDAELAGASIADIGTEIFGSSPKNAASTRGAIALKKARQMWRYF